MSLGVVAFILALTLSIALHELGHLLTAKAFGMKATQYFIGFGPRLWSFRKGETEYGFKAIPAGGYVKIVGMTQLEELDPGDEERAFWRQPAPKRAVVLVAGSTMHFIIAFVAVLIAVVGIGVPEASTTVAEVSPCVTKSDPTTCTSADPAGPAAAAGVLPGDRVVSFDGQPVEEWTEDLTTRVRARPAGPVDLVVERDGRELTLRPVVVQVQRPDLDDATKTVTVGALGLAPGDRTDRLGPVSGLRQSGVFMGEAVWGSLKGIAMLPGQVDDLAKAAFNRDRERKDGIASVVGIGRASGQIVDDGQWANFLGLIAALNVFVGIFNLVPLLPLDGGHLGVLGFEQARSALARWRRRPEPGRVDLRKLMPVTWAFLIFIVTLQALVLYADIANPIPALGG